jgi:hypothetical protein
MMRATTLKKTLIAVFVSIAGRIPGVGHMVDVLKGLPIDAKHRRGRKPWSKSWGLSTGNSAPRGGRFESLPMRSHDWRYCPV